jgi:hypothetical protein
MRGKDMPTSSLQGGLETFRLPEVLTFLSTTRKTGTLVAAHENQKASVYFDAGALVFAASNQQSLRLGELLLRKKRITRAELEQVDARMQSDGTPFGQLAVQLGIFTEAQLRDALKIQVSEILFDAFLWKGGTFVFFDEMSLPPYAITISVDLANLIMEGARRIGEWEECVRLLPHKSAVFRVVPSPGAEKITLSLDEWKVLFLINGRRTLEELAGEVGEPLQVYRVVYGLLSNKLIEPVSAELGDGTDATVKQGPVNFAAESTLREFEDDTSLLISSEARLSYADVVTPVVAQLTIIGGTAPNTVIALTESEYRIGRQRDNEIQLQDLGVSGHHARIYRGPDGYAVEDLKSRNGTWVNGARVYHATLQNGDTLRVGITDLRFQVLSATS